jgi:hypothetical protein
VFTGGYSIAMNRTGRPFLSIVRIDDSPAVAEVSGELRMTIDRMDHRTYASSRS